MEHLYHALALDPEREVPSWWQASAPTLEAAAAPLEGDHDCEVAIIGGGYTGLSAALHLARDHHVQARVLERASIGWGASGRNGGFVCVGASKLSYPQMQRLYGEPAMQGFFRCQREAVETVAGLLREESIDAEATGEGEFMLAHLPGRCARLRAEADYLRRTFGIRTQYLERGQLGERGVASPAFHGALWWEVGFALHPLRYVRGLARAAAARGARLHPHSPVTAWRREGGRHRLVTPAGSVRAERVVIATNGYTPEDLHPQFGGRVLPALSSICVTRPLSAEEIAAQGWTTTTPAVDSRRLLHYFRLLPDGRFLFGGRGGTDAAPEALARQQGRVEAAFRSLFPAWKEVPVTHRWSGFVCLARDLLPHVGPWHEQPGVYVALAYHGNGVATATWSGRALARLIAGQPVELPPMLSAPPPRYPLPGLRVGYLKAAYVWYGLRDALP